MSDTGEKSQKERDNLARIRENQRRSRARRKEYLNELETKLRNCEQTGVGATAHVQIAAKQVLDENKRLRALLHLKGITDAEIDAFELNGVSNGGTYESIPASIALESMLKNRTPCGGVRRMDFSPSPTLSIQTSHQSSMPPTLVLPAPSTGGQELAVPSPSFARQQAAWTDPGIAPNNTMSNATAAALYPVASAVDYGMLQSWPQEYPDPSTNAAPFSTCSCAEAASMIREMGGEVNPDLPQELGCHPDDPQCRASSSLVFDMIDRYQQSGIGP